MERRILKIMKKYHLELNDLRALMSVIDTTMTICIGLSYAWVGVFMAVIALINDFTHRNKINSYAMHLSSLIVNLYLVLVFGKK